MGIDGDLHPQATQYSGMTLRDYFAGRALVPLLEMYTTDDATKGAYMVADLMLEARKK